MAARQLNLQVTGPAQIAYSALGLQDRRIVDAWFDHLRNWQADAFAREHSRRLKAGEELYALQTTKDNLIIVFRVARDTVDVTSIVDKGWLRAFEEAREHSAV